MHALDEILLSPGEEISDLTPSALLCGSGGVGKTALALHWSHSRKSFFPDGQLYLDLRGFSPDEPLTPGEALASFLYALGVPTSKLPSAIDQRRALYLTLTSGRRLLVVLDNARTVEQIRAVLPGTASCSVLATSRLSMAGLAIREGTSTVSVGLLSPGESLTLLRAALKNRLDTEEEGARELVEQCGRLPLALRIAAESAIFRSKTSLSEIAHELRDTRSRLDLLSRGEDTSTKVRAVFTWSYEALGEEEARGFLLLGGFPGPHAVPASFAALLGRTEADATHILHALTRAHLMSETDSHRFTSHDLLRAYAAELAAAELVLVRQARARCWAYYLRTVEAADCLIASHRYRVSLPAETLEIPVPSFTDSDAALMWYATERDNLIALFESPDPEHRESCWRLAQLMRGYFFHTRDLDAWIITHESALRAARELGDAHAEALTLNNLGMAFRKRDKTKAADCYRAALDMFDRLGDVRSATDSVANLAAVFRASGRLDTSIEYGRRALTSYRRLGLNRNVGITQRSLAKAYMGRGRIAEARAAFDESVSVLDAIEDWTNLAMVLNRRGELFVTTAEWSRCRQDFGRALELSESQRIPYEEARALHGLGRVDQVTGSLGDAEVKWARALAIYTRLGAEEAGELRALMEE